MDVYANQIKMEECLTTMTKEISIEHFDMLNAYNDYLKQKILIDAKIKQYESDRHKLFLKYNETKQIKEGQLLIKLQTANSQEWEVYNLLLNNLKKLG
jgi:hypothetical protein